MSHSRLHLALPILACVFASAAIAAPIDFNRDIRPILSDNCYACHGNDAKTREADLRLDTAAGSRADLGGYAAIVPGKPAESELFKRITSEDKTERMPPRKTNKTLAPKQIALLKQWIEEGGKYDEHWAYRKPVKVALPQTMMRTTNPIDRFIYNRLDREKLGPPPRMVGAPLVRRLSFDLIGLPPKPTEADYFLKHGIDNYVDNLLASPHFGERMAIMWLDLVRFADTVGYHGDQDHSIAPYRDYVIKSFNENLPFNVFTLDQIAGDLMPNPDMWQRIATGYNRMLQTSHEGGVQPGEYMAKYMADRVRNVSEVWLGATMGCAECHNHKFDPYTQADFYSMGAFFADVDEAKHFKVAGNTLPTERPPEIRVWDLRQYNAIKKIDEELRASDALLRDIQNQPDKETRDRQTAEMKKEIAKLTEERASIQKAFRLTMVTQAIPPREIRILPRGNWLDQSGPVVQPAVPAFLGELETQGRATRRDLAQWLVSRDNPLTARVFVNRLWAMYFGEGLCRSLDDFGAQGQSPDHPELLDWLAVEFMEKGWNVKHIVKLMVTSQAYQMASVHQDWHRERDPENRLRTRQSRFRLPAELVRDNALAVSGLLNREIGGPSVKPYQPAKYYRHLNFPKREYMADHDEQQYRRGVYMHWQRQFLHPMLRAFDAPMREECTAKRPRSNTPLASLVLLNDPTFIEAARAFAVRIMQQEGDVESRVKWAWKQALTREANGREIAVLKAIFESDLAEYRADKDAAARLLNIGLYKTPENLDPAEVAAWTSVARAIFNLNEMITRN